MDKTCEPIMTRLKELRESKGLTQAELANLIGVTQQAVCHWEKGKKTPKTNIIKHIAKALGVSTSEILDCIIADE